MTVENAFGSGVVSSAIYGDGRTWSSEANEQGRPTIIANMYKIFLLIV